MPYELIIRSLYNEARVEYDSLEDICRDFHPCRDKEFMEYIRGNAPESEKIDSIVECLDAQGLPFSPEDDSPCTFRIVKLS